MTVLSKRQETHFSKLLSLVLRHQPEHIGLTLDANGWAEVNALLEGINANETTPLTFATLQQIVANNDKKRFMLSDDGSRIRANQGHSVAVDLQLEVKIPPPVLYHGTATRFLDGILQTGLKPQQRQHVHLSDNLETAMSVGQRYGKPVILLIDTQAMSKQGYQFYQAQNNVWLCNDVPTDFITRHQS